VVLQEQANELIKKKCLNRPQASEASKVRGANTLNSQVGRVGEQGKQSKAGKSFQGLTPFLIVRGRGKQAVCSHTSQIM